jgi:hypothetical protein
VRERIVRVAVAAVAIALLLFAVGDLLIGADGINSRVRDQLLPQARPVPTEALSVASRVPLTDATRRWLPDRFAASMNMIVAPAPYFLFTSAYAGRARSDHSHDERLGYVLCALVAHRDALPARVHTMDGPALQGVAADLTAGWHPDLRRPPPPSRTRFRCRPIVPPGSLRPGRPRTSR